MRTWSDDFTATQARDTAGFSLAGHQLDVAFDPSGAAWGIGEFGMQATRAQGSTLTKHNIPLKTYVEDGQLVGWTQPFQSLASGQRSSGSDLGESVIYAAGATWVAQGGGQQASTPEQPFTGNHSILTRISTTAPYASCAIPIPGDNQHLIGLAHDTKRNRIYFATSEGPDGSKIGWVKASGLGSRCQNDLDYGGNPSLSEEANADLRAAAQRKVDSLLCTPSQDLSAATNCVHVSSVSMPTGAAHLAYDATADSLWMTNWGDRKLRQYRPATNVLITHQAPPSSYDGWALPWQIAASSTHVFMNEYNGNRLLAYNKAARTWSVLATPVNALGVPADQVQTHSLTLAGGNLWFTVSDEDGNAATAVGRVIVSQWAAGTPKGVLYTGWETLPGGAHSFRGVDVSPNGVVALADAPDRSTLLLTPKGVGR